MNKYVFKNLLSQRQTIYILTKNKTYCKNQLKSCVNYMLLHTKSDSCLSFKGTVNKDERHLDIK